MSRDLNDLDKKFKKKVEKLLVACEDRGVIMVPFSTVRDVYDQARLWREGRATKQIKQTIDFLRENGASYLADVIESVGPQMGDKIKTNGIPGNSWHHFGVAVDCVWKKDGETSWDNESEGNGYQVYAEIAREMGLNAGHFWSSVHDSVHVQDKPESSPRRAGMTWAEISDAMEEFAKSKAENESGISS